MARLVIIVLLFALLQLSRPKKHSASATANAYLIIIIIIIIIIIAITTTSTGVTFVLTPQMFRTSFAMILCNFLIFLSSHRSILQNFHIYDLTAFISPVNAHQIRFFGPNFIMFKHTVLKSL